MTETGSRLAPRKPGVIHSFLNRYSTVVCLLCVLSAVEICVQYSKQARNQETINSQFCQTVSYFAVLPRAHSTTGSQSGSSSIASAYALKPAAVAANFLRSLTESA